MKSSNVASPISPFSNRSIQFKLLDVMCNAIRPSVTHSMSSYEGVDSDPQSSILVTDQKLFICDICNDDFDNSSIFLKSIETETKVRRAIKILKKEKKKVEKEMLNNLELATEKMTQYDACSSPRANRIGKLETILYKLQFYCANQNSLFFYYSCSNRHEKSSKHGATC